MAEQKKKPEPKAKWHQKWWGVFLLIVMALIVVSVGVFIYQYVFYLQLYIQGKQSAQEENVNATPAIEVPSLIDVRNVVETTDDPSWGPAEADIVIVEFSDFQCPFCKQTFPVIQQLEQDYGDEIKFIYRDFPNSEIHPQALDAAMAGECADEQGMFWDYHKFLFMNQDNLAVDNLKKIARDIGLNSEQFNNCLDTKKYQMEVLNDLDDGSNLGVVATPTFFINGNLVQGAIDYQTFKIIIDRIKEILREEQAL